MHAVISLIVGLIFGIGLVVSGMANPAKTLGFLDIASLWDPSLALVMGSAISVGAFAFAFARRMPRSFTATPMQLPEARHIDRRLIFGSIVFGVGWGLAGFCPGAAVVALGAGAPKALLFSSMMVVGMLVYETLQPRPKAIKNSSNQPHLEISLKRQSV